MRPKKIGLAGKSGSGKDLIADMICRRFGYRKIAVADNIRNECASFLEDALEIIAKPQKMDLPQSFDLVIEAFMTAVYTKPTTPEMRVLLQWWGTEYRRSQDPNYWIRLLDFKLDNDDKIVISDVRLPDEVTSVRKAGGEVWYVERLGIGDVGISGHATENGLVGIQFDKTILNFGTVEELESKVAKLFV